MISADYSGTPPVDPFPKPGSALVGSADPDFAVADDFNGTPRSGTLDVGAYKFDQNGNPGWTISGSFKFIADQVRPLPPGSLEAN